MQLQCHNFYYATLVKRGCSTMRRQDSTNRPLTNQQTITDRFCPLCHYCRDFPDRRADHGLGPVRDHGHRTLLDLDHDYHGHGHGHDHIHDRDHRGRDMNRVHLLVPGVAVALVLELALAIELVLESGCDPAATPFLSAPPPLPPLHSEVQHRGNLEDGALYTDVAFCLPLPEHHGSMYALLREAGDRAYAKGARACEAGGAEAQRCGSSAEAQRF